ncbi:hypothetical protein Leryth_023692 [Lithospermum erythrorhizon]|nr:hypothetical protein Leryth_023692 [Lithospermum erythrorhizon]
MAGMRSDVRWLNLEILVGLLLLYVVSISDAITNLADVAAINNLYVSLGSPALPLWVASGGDPCGEAWQGVTCDTSNNIISITISAANLGGELGENFGDFSSIQTVLLSNNHIGGSIPTNLPPTLQNLFLSSNLFTGNIPSSLSSLTGLSAMSLNDNQLTGEIPDSFQSLQSLVNLDMSTNNLSGQLPPSLGNLSSIRTIHLQNNQLSGTLDVLQDLPLSDLNIANNQFSGPIPDKLLSLPTFKKDGNPFNSSITPSPPPSSSTSPPMPPFFGAGPSTSVQAPPGTGRTPPGTGRTPPASGQTRGKQAEGPSTTEDSSSKSTKKSSSTKKIIWISIVAVVSVIILILAILLCIPKCITGKRERHRVSKRHEIAPYMGDRDNPRTNASLVQPRHQEEKAPPVKVERPKEEHQQGPRKTSPPSKPPKEPNVQKLSAIPKQHDHEIDLSRFDIDLMVPPPPPPPPATPPPPPVLPEKVIVKPIAPTEVTTQKSPTRPLPSTSVKSFSIASLQLYTDSFSQDNLLGTGMLGTVYRAELPNGKLLAVKKLDKRVSNQQKDDEFLEMVNNLDKIRHANVVELMGYCAEHGQRLLIYEYCSNGTLQDALHSDDEFKKNLSWNARIRMALGAARALEYLHEVCDPPMIHRNFKSTNILLDDELSVYVSDCGLAPLISSGAVSQLSGQLLTTYGYGAPEFESGIYTSKSDVYSFGVVMLEILTGRMSYDRSATKWNNPLSDGRYHSFMILMLCQVWLILLSMENLPKRISY